MHQLRRQRGLTLMELLQTVGIVAIVLSFGVPSMTSMVRKNQAVTYTNEILSTIHAARSQAMQNVVQITICKSKDQVRCTAGANWRTGWIAFADRNQNQVRDMGDDAEEIVYAHARLDDSYAMQSDAFADWIAFRPNGMAIGSNGNAGMIELCNSSHPDVNRAVSISRTGSPSIETIGAGACK